jgi:flagellar protein FlaG
MERTECAGSGGQQFHKKIPEKLRGVPIRGSKRDTVVNTEAISPVASSSPAPQPSPAPVATSKEDRQATLAVAKAVQKLNAATFAGEGREITFSLNPETRRPIIKVVESDTREVVAQWPTDYVLEQAENLDPPLSD